MKMKVRFYAQLLAFALLLLTVFVLPTAAQSVDGLWDATVTLNDRPIPFRIEISGQGSAVRSFFFNGDEKVNPSTEGTFRDANLTLKFASYATELKATLKDEILTGSYEGGPGSSYPLEARRHNPSLATAGNPRAPNIDGRWEIQVKSPQGRVGMALHCEAVRRRRLGDNPAGGWRHREHFLAATKTGSLFSVTSRVNGLSTWKRRPSTTAACALTSVTTGKNKS